jgi:hypothetical protein
VGNKKIFFGFTSRRAEVCPPVFRHWLINQLIPLGFILSHYNEPPLIMLLVRAFRVHFAEQYSSEIHGKIGKETKYLRSIGKREKSLSCIGLFRDIAITLL